MATPRGIFTEFPENPNSNRLFVLASEENNQTVTIHCVAQFSTLDSVRSDSVLLTVLGEGLFIYVAENEHYSVAYISIAPTRSLRYISEFPLRVYSAYEPRPGSSDIRRFEREYAIEIRDGIMFVFYSGLPHMYLHITYS